MTDASKPSCTGFAVKRSPTKRVTAAAIGDVHKAISVATAQGALGLSRRATASLSRLQTTLP